MTPYDALCVSERLDRERMALARSMTPYDTL